MNNEQVLNNYNPLPYTGCWIWDGRLEWNGYGRVWYEGRFEIAHRIVYRLTHNINIDDVFICHKCDERSCVNPDHMFIGNQKDNMQDRNEKSRQAKGEKHGMHKLNRWEVFNIRKLLTETNMKQKEIAGMFGVTSMTISNIHKRHSWRWLDWCGEYSPKDAANGKEEER